MIEQLIENTIFHTLREKLVVLGYLPDISNYDIYSPDPAVQAQAILAYKNAMTQIANTKGFCIDLMNFSSNQAKGMKRTPRIVIDPQTFLPGFTGNDTTFTYVRDEATGYYTRQTRDSIKSDFTFNLYLVADNSQQMLVMNNLLVQVLPKRGYIKRIDKVGLEFSGNFFIRQTDAQRNNDLPEGIMERMFRYEIPDIDEVIIDIPGEVAPIVNINVGIEIGNSRDNLEVGI